MLLIKKKKKCIVLNKSNKLVFTEFRSTTNTIESTCALQPTLLQLILSSYP